MTQDLSVLFDLYPRKTKARPAAAADRGTRLAKHPQDGGGKNALRSRTRHQMIRKIFDGCLAARADVLCSNTFNRTAAPQKDCGMAQLLAEMTVAELTLGGAWLGCDHVADHAARIGMRGPEVEIRLQPGLNDTPERASPQPGRNIA